MAEDALAVGENRELKLGSSFRSCKEKLFHTIRYDFRPASIDVNSAGRIKIGGNKDCTVTLPHHQNIVNDVKTLQQYTGTEFRGSMRPCSKECILLINKRSKAITLERIGSHMQLKRTKMVNCDVNSETIKVKSRRTSEIPDNDTKLNVSDCKRLPSKSSVTAISRDIRKATGRESERHSRLSASSSDDEFDSNVQNDNRKYINNDSSSSSDNSDSSESEENMIPQYTLTTTVSQNTRSASDNKRRTLYDAAKNDLEDGILNEDLRLTDSDTDTS